MALKKADITVPRAVDEMFNVALTTEFDEFATNQGAMFSRTYYETALANNAFMTIGIYISPGHQMHIKNIQLYSLNGPMKFQFYPFASFTDGSVFITPNNHLICPDTPESIVTMCTDPTDLVLTGKVQEFYYGNANSLPFQYNATVFSPAAKYIVGAALGGKHLVRIQNLSGDAVLSQIIIHWLEVETH